MTAPEIIHQLVKRFDEHRDAYRSGKYNETQLRREFLDPFFDALGWDVFNRQGHAEMYKDVIHEDSLEIEGENKAPDYAFRVGGQRKFFLEAKKPAVKIETDIHPAFQLRRYAWSAKLPLSLLSDFEEFAIYDCRAKPDKRDKASVGRIRLYSYRDYIEKWDEIAAIFSREAVLKGSFDAFAEGNKLKKGTAEVDDAFLSEIERWRDLLATNIAIRNPSLNVREMNYAVQMTIDRIVFLRICEDRGVERDEQLKEIGTPSALAGTSPKSDRSSSDLGEDGKGRVYEALCQLFKRADARYNSGLFHFSDEKDASSPTDSLTLTIKIDDKPLQDILKNLYYPESPYVFREIPSDILGQVYERFLGKVIRLTASHRAKVEEKPEVRKAGGVYYTPTYIVEYIVENTVGKLVARGKLENGRLVDGGMTPKDVEKLKILDPACGSGTFPLGAYQYLLDWHLKWYIEHEPEKWASGKKPAIFQSKDGYRLTTSKKKDILLNNIHGVDIDPQAVEVTKLSLLLKVLEGESHETIGSQLALFQERVLPDLGKNIKCGNSLIGSDYYEGRQLTMLVDEEERYRVNAFDWKAEFPQVFVAGGFDAVIGNPPYVRQESLALYKEYFQQSFKSYSSGSDLYIYFIEKGIDLLRPDGLYSIIVSSSFLKASYGKSLRIFIKKDNAVLRIVDFGGLSIFEDAKDTYVCIPLIQRKSKSNEVEVCKVNNFDFQVLGDYILENKYIIPPEQLSENNWSLENRANTELFTKLKENSRTLGEYSSGKIYYGLKTGLNEAFEITPEQAKDIVKKAPHCETLIKSFAGGQDIRRYYLESKKRFLIVIPSGWTKSQLVKNGKDSFTENAAWDWFSKTYKPLAEHLWTFAEAAKKRQDKGNFWWELRPCDYYDALDAPKIIYPDIAKNTRFYLDTSGLYIANTAYCLGLNDYYLLGILNSKLTWFAISQISIPFGVRAGEFRYRLIYQYMEQLPIRPINFSDPADKARHDKMVSLVERMLALHKTPSAFGTSAKSQSAGLGGGRTPQEQEMVRREIESTDKAIDRLVYELYGLTEEEIKIIES